MAHHRRRRSFGSFLSQLVMRMMAFLFGSMLIIVCGHIMLFDNTESDGVAAFLSFILCIIGLIIVLAALLYKQLLQRD